MTKTEIVDTAFKVWGRNFYRKTSLNQLACELKVSKSALYRHFESKQALNNAMTERFFDDFAAYVRSGFEQALQTPDADKGIFTIIQSIAGYFARNEYILIFALINLYDSYDYKQDTQTIAECIKNKGADLKTLHLVIEKKYDANPSVLRLIIATLILYVSHCHKINDTFEKTLSDNEIQEVVSAIYNIAQHGLGYTDENANIDFEKLEKNINGTAVNMEPEPLFKAVAEAVAEAGPWNTSMKMVAKHMGLSKSSLYGHFKDKKDMLRRLFLGEFKRIIDFAKQGITLSANTAEQLYLGIYSIAVYLRTRPEILVTMSWIRTRKLDFGKPDDESLEIFRLFEDIKIKTLQDAPEEEKQKKSHWIIFLLINILMRNHNDENEQHDFAENDDLRTLYKFITMGLGGFIR